MVDYFGLQRAIVSIFRAAFMSAGTCCGGGRSVGLLIRGPLEGVSEGSAGIKSPFFCIKRPLAPSPALHLKLPIHTGPVILANSNKTTQQQPAMRGNHRHPPVYAGGERPDARFMDERSLLGVRE